jgi:hypothetical protein
MSRNILNEGRIFINTINSGSAINISSTNSTSSTANVKISKQVAKTIPVNTDLFLLEEADGSIKKITYQNLESNIDTNFWTYSAPSLRPDNTTDNILLGTTTNTDNRKLIVFGDSEFGDIYMPTDKKIISKNDSNDFVKFGNNTLSINYGGGVLISNNLVMGSTADIILSAGGVGISRAGSSTDKIFFNSGNFTFGNMGVFNNSIQVKSTDNASSGSITFFEASNNGTNNLKLIAPASMSDCVLNLPSFTGNETLALSSSVPNLTTAENFGTALSKTDPDTLNLGTGGNSSGVGTTTNIDGYNINIGKLVSNGSPNNSATEGANEITIQATQYYSGNPKINITAQSASGVVNTGAEVNITSKKNGSGSDTAKITMIADTEIVMNTGFKINSSGAITALGAVLTNNLIDTGIADNKLVEIDSSTVADNDYAKFTSVGLEGRSFTEVASDIGSSITTVGTITTGTWNGSAISANYGGTGFQTYTIGDILYANTTTTLQKLNIGSNNQFLMSNGSNPIWSNGFSFDSPLQLSSNSVSFGGLSGFGSSNQILATNGTDAIQYRTLTEGTNISISHSSSAITISSSENYWERTTNVSSFDIQPTSTVDNLELDDLNLLTVPKTINVIPSGLLSTGILIQYDSGLGGGNGSMVFGDNGSSASANWDTGIYAKQFINFKCGTKTMLLFNNTTANVSSTTFSTDNFNITLDSNNSYQNISYVNAKPLMLLNTASSGAVHSHLVMKKDSSQTDYVILRQNNSGELLVHFENNGDRFKFSKNWEYGHAYAMWYYDNSAYTYFRNPSGTNSANSFAGSYFAFHNNGSVIFLNTPSSGTSAGDYIGFSTGGVAKGRMSMDGNFKITGTITESHTFCDERVKENIKDYDTNAIELLNKLKIKSFNRKTFDNYKAGEDGILLPFSQRFSDKSYYDIGLIAQDILTEVPELEFLVENQDGGDIEPMTIPSWSPLTAICIKAIQEQKEQIDNLTALVQNQQLVINNLLSATTFANFKKM